MLTRSDIIFAVFLCILCIGTLLLVSHAAVALLGWAYPHNPISIWWVFVPLAAFAAAGAVRGAMR